MEKRNKIYEGKAKILYDTDSPDHLIQYFKDDATAFNAAKKGTIKEKGVMNNSISARMFEFLKAEGIDSHFVEKLNDREMVVKKVEIIPVEVIIRNIAAGSLCRNYGVEEGKKLACPVLEFSYKRDDLNDPLMNTYHIRAFELASDEEIEQISRDALKVNELMKIFFSKLKLDLVDFKLEFGRSQGEVILADEISPDTCRLWEVGTGNKLDKDRFRHDLGNIEEAYQEVLKRISV
jgi:phosphoribosylaminoimidazole-succinocarboxamide synthase